MCLAYSWLIRLGLANGLAEEKLAERMAALSLLGSQLDHTFLQSASLVSFDAAGLVMTGVWASKYPADRLVLDETESVLVVGLLD